MTELTRTNLLEAAARLTDGKRNRVNSYELNSVN
jgi:hypothetical protein